MASQIQGYLTEDDYITVTQNGLRFGFEQDYALFAVWGSAQQKIEDIKAFLSDKFTVIKCIDLTWTEKHFHSNAKRLYEEYMSYSDLGYGRLSNNAEKIENRNITIIVVRDDAPEYLYDVSVSGAVEACNKSITNAKRELRGWFEHSYKVHSNNNLKEFLRQFTLLFGVVAIQDLLDNGDFSFEEKDKDLEGANGWKSWKHLFDVLNWTAPYLILRNYDGLPKVLNDTDIDFLTDNYQALASILGLDQMSLQKPYKGKISVAGQSVLVDVRFVGDGYYDALWAKNMLQTRHKIEGFFIPQHDHLFFSLLYHVLIHKHEIADKYKSLLPALYKDLTGKFLDLESSNYKVQLLQIINGYFITTGYSYAKPLDSGVVVNSLNAQKIKSSLSNRLKPSLSRVLIIKLKFLIKRFILRRI